MAWYNQTRQVEQLLAKHDAHSPSFTVNLHPEHWTLNNGSKFLYNNHFASILDDIRSQQIPADFIDLFDAARTPFYEGCLIVEISDYRPRKPSDPPLDVPLRKRTVLQPTAESLWADICLLNSKNGNKWTDIDALEVESKILLATTPQLCLDPDPNLTRMVNHISRVSAPPIPVSLKRKAAAVVQEEDETDKARRAKIMQFMNSRPSRPANFRVLEVIQKSKQSKPQTPAPSQSQAPPQQQAPPAAPTPAHHPSPAAAAITQPVQVASKQPLAPSTQQPKIAPIQTPMTFSVQNPAAMQQARIPAANQHFQGQNVAKPNTPSPLTQAPAFAVQAQPGLERPPSRHPTPASQPNPVPQQQASPHVQASAPSVQPASTFQAAIPNAQFLQQVPAIRNNQVKMGKAPGSAQTPPFTPQQYQLYMQRLQAYQQQQQTAQGLKPAVPPQTQPQPQTQAQQHQAAPVTAQAQPTPQQGQATMLQQQQQMFQYQQQQQQHAAAQLQSGRASAAPGAQVASALRASPHVTNQRIASRSPLPPQAQLPQQAHTPQPQVQFPYNAANPAQYRGTAGAQAGSASPQAAPAQQRPAGNAAQVYTYGYPQMYLPGRMPANAQQAAMYWQATRMPQMNGQIQGMNINMQQFQQQQMQQAQQQQQNMKPAGR